MRPDTSSRASWATTFFNGPVSWILLTISQLVAVLLCLAIPFGVWHLLEALAHLEQFCLEARSLGVPWSWQAVHAVQTVRFIVILGGFLLFCLSAAVWIVFKRTKAIVLLANRQEDENQRLWQAIEELRKSMLER